MKTRRKFKRKKNKTIPEDIGDYVAYSEESRTGLVNKVHRSSNSLVGQETGANSLGYFVLFFRNKSYKNHRVIYFLCTGIDPEEKQVDHIDGNKSNNKISNLRLATHNQNQHNKKRPKNNTSGVTGVHFEKKTGKWASHANLIVCRKVRLGLFKSFNEAVAVRIVAEKDPRFNDQEYRNDHNDKYIPPPEMLDWAKQYLEDRIERLNWNEKLQKIK
jgi:hypothetical protein